MKIGYAPWPEKPDLLTEVDTLCEELKARYRGHELKAAKPGKDLKARLGDVLLRLQDASELNFRQNGEFLSGPEARAALSRVRNVLAGGRRGEGRKGPTQKVERWASDFWREIAEPLIGRIPPSEKGRREMRQRLGLAGKRRRSPRRISR